MTRRPAAPARPLGALVVVAACAGVGLAACPEPVPGPFVSEPDGVTFFDTGFFVDASFDTSGGTTYHPTVRAALSRCVGCHGADGPVAPPLHSYLTARNAVDEVRRTIVTGHIGDFTGLQIGCGALTDETPEMFIVTLDGLLQSWRAGGFPAGVPGDEEGPPPPPSPAAQRSVEPIAASAPRCYRLGELAGDVERVEVDADGLAWVELYAVAAPLAPSLDALESADAGAGWACEADLGLVPQPLVWAWQLGDPAADLTDAPVRVGPGTTLVARVDASLVEATAATGALDVAFWFDDDSPAARAFVPLASNASLVLPWLTPTEAPPTLTTLYSTSTVSSLRRVDEDGDATCLHARTVPGVWPELTSPPGSALEAAQRLDLDCFAERPCAAQVALVGVERAAPCDATTAACASACGDLACAWACAEAAGGRCALSVLMGQLACRVHECDEAVRAAQDRLEACGASAAPGACITTTVIPLLAACTTGPLCGAALDACFPFEG